MEKSACQVDDCDRKRTRRGLCTSHYTRFVEYGDPLKGPPIRRKRKDGSTLAEALAFDTPSGLSPDECWPWQGNIAATGYGRVSVDGKVLNAHRAVMVNLHGDLPEDSVVRHTCDNPPCVNPSHLLLGTQSENVEDKRGGRARQGRQILTEDDVRAIRQRVKSGETVRAVSLDYPQVTYHHLTSVVREEAWWWV